MTTTLGTDRVAVRLLDSIAATIECNRFQYNDERALQASLADPLAPAPDTRDRVRLLAEQLRRRRKVVRA